MGIFDTALAVAEEVAPAWAERRARSRAMRRVLNSGYSQHGASHTKKSLQGWQTTQGGPDADITDNLETLRERSRDLCMGEALAIGALKTIRTNEIGAGLRLNSQIDSKFLGLSDDEAQAWEDLTEREFAIWAGSRSCDAARRATFGELQALARLSQLMSGDVFALLPSVERKGERYDLRIQLLEADRVCNPPTVQVGADILEGVEIGPYGEPVAYWITSRHPGDVLSGNRFRVVGEQKWRRVPAFGEETGLPLVLHLMEQDRPGQRRGVPILAPVMERFKQLGRYTDAEIMAAVVAGFFTVAITSDAPQTPLGPSIPPTQQINTGANADASAVELGNGAVVGLAPGEKVEALNPTRPNAGFEPFVAALCKQIGAGIGLPYELVVMQFESSYSASRAALLEAWKRFTVGRAWLASGFCQPIYEAWLTEAIARGYIQAPGFFDNPLRRAAWCGAEWVGPTQGQLDPTKEVEAAALRVANGFSTRTRETRELTGGDWWDFHRLRVREEEARREGKVAAEASPSAAAAPSAPSSTAAAPAAPAPALFLAPDAIAAIVTVDEGREARGATPVGGEVGDRWIAEHMHIVAADSAPQIAKVAAAEKAKAAQAAAPAETADAPDPDGDPDGDTDGDPEEDAS